MLDNIIESCWNKDNKSTDKVEKDYPCPICSKKSQEVENITVKYFVHDSLIDKIQDSKYYLCLNETCPVTYFNSDQASVFEEKDMRIPIWFKKDSDPKYICYCNNVTLEQIINAILYENARNMKDIIKLTGAMKNGMCEIKNPLGKCCGPIIQEIIDKTVVKIS